MDEHARTKNVVREYYGKILSTSDDLKTSACCAREAPPAGLREALTNLHEEVRAKYYGCGLVAPEHLDGARVLDLGRGAGQDVFVLAQMVGPKGKVVGVDMTAEQLAIARKHQDWHTIKFGHCCSNVAFVEGYIEELDGLGVEPASFDVIVSNCVINLSRQGRRSRGRALATQARRRDVFRRRVRGSSPPRCTQGRSGALGRMLGRALYRGRFPRSVAEGGLRRCAPRHRAHALCRRSRAGGKLDAARFYSATYRLFNIAGLEARCEDYGQAVIYRGGNLGHETHPRGLWRVAEAARRRGDRPLLSASGRSERSDRGRRRHGQRPDRRRQGQAFRLVGAGRRDGAPALTRCSRSRRFRTNIRCGPEGRRRTASSRRARTSASACALQPAREGLPDRRHVQGHEARARTRASAGSPRGRACAARRRTSGRPVLALISPLRRARSLPLTKRQNSAIASRNWSGVMGGRPSALQGSCLRGVPPYFRRPVFAGLAVALLMRLRSWPTRDGGGGLKLVSWEHLVPCAPHGYRCASEPGAGHARCRSQSLVADAVATVPRRAAETAASRRRFSSFSPLRCIV